MQPPQERRARENRDNILHALRVLDKTTSGKITKFIGKKVEREVNQKYANYEWESYDKSTLAKFIKNDLEWKKITKRTVQSWLPDL